MGRMIFHVDINSYFATILQQENPALRGKPIGIVKDLGRTCVIAASVEAKKYGVKTGCNAYDATRLCPNIKFIPAAFDLYLSTTKKMKAVFTALCPDPHIFSLDEAFLDMRGCEVMMRQKVNAEKKLKASSGDLKHQFGILIQEKIKESLGEWVRCNVGISHNKLLAKMAGEIAPKGTVSEITKENLDEVLSRVSFNDVCGVGVRLARRLKALGVTTPLQINLLTDETLLTQFGPFWGVELRKIGQGEETHFFTHAPSVDHMQSVGRTITGFKLCNDEHVIKRTLLNLLEEATYKVRHMDLAGRGVAIFLGGHETGWARSLRLKRYVRHTNEIFDLIYRQLYLNWQRTFPVIRFGVFVFDLKPMRDIPLCLLPDFQRNEKLYETIDRVNDRFGLFTLRPATLDAHIIRPEVTGFLGDKIFHGI